jgi:hypothetical protein
VDEVRKDIPGHCITALHDAVESATLPGSPACAVHILLSEKFTGCTSAPSVLTGFPMRKKFGTLIASIHSE